MLLRRLDNSAAKIAQSCFASTSSKSLPPLIEAARSPYYFRNTKQLANHIANNVIYHLPGRFLIIPKPYGIATLGYSQKNGGVFKSSVFRDQDTQEEGDYEPQIRSQGPTLEDCIPYLSEKFSEPELQICIGIKRNLSGPVILPANPVDSNNLIDSIRLASKQRGNMFQHHALAIVLGKPPGKDKLSGYATFQTAGNHSEYIFVEGKASKRAKSGKFAVEGDLEWDIIAEGHGMSLLSIRFSKFARHFPRLALSHLLCPILGDTIYMNRLVEIDEAPALLQPAEVYKRKLNTWLPPEFASLSGLTRATVRQLPLFLHVFRSVYPRFGRVIGGSKKQNIDAVDLVASMDPPPHFIAMTQALGFSKQLAAFMARTEQEREEAGEAQTLTGETVF